MNLGEKKRNNIKLKALTLSSLDLNDPVDEAVS